MSSPTHDHRVLVVAPTGGDAKNVGAFLEKAGFRSYAVENVALAAEEIRRGCGALLVTEEALGSAHRQALQTTLEKQPAWSNLPVILITSGGSHATTQNSRRGFDSRFHITLLERPLRAVTLLASVEAALGSREQQYKIRDLIAERESLLASLETRVTERTEKLQAMVEELEAFSYSVSHDLRAPLRVIYGYADAIQEDHAQDLSPECHDLVRKISNAAKRMDRLTQDLLAYTRVANGELAVESVNLDEIIRDVIEGYPTLSEARDRIIVQTPLGHCLGHAPSLAQCFSNLIENALKFTRPNEPAQVEVSTEPCGARLGIKIVDRGIGIDAGDHKRVFGLFERVNNLTEGTGVGLAIVKKAVERMNGRIDLNSARGKGSTFWNRAGRSAFMNPEPVILLVEDSDDDRFFAIRALKKAGLTKVHHVENGRDAVDYLGGSGQYADRVNFPMPNIILIDLKIPEINGHQVLEWVDAQPTRKTCLAYVLSSSGEASDRARADAAHADGYFIKPLTQQNISAILDRFSRK